MTKTEICSTVWIAIGVACLVSIPTSISLRHDGDYEHAFKVGQMHYEANVVIELNPFESNRQRLGWFEGWIEAASPPDESDGA